MTRSGSLVAPYTAGEAQRLAVQVGAQDMLGNLRWQGWVRSMWTGPARRTTSSLTPGHAVYNRLAGQRLQPAGHRPPRRADARAAAACSSFYATWDQQALRLAWTGANWNTDGDLFIYLDTGAGGADAVFRPYPSVVTGTVVSLPAGMGADAVIWVQDGRTATLLRWDSAASAWGSPSPLSDKQYRFDPSLRGGQTDLYLPFAASRA